MAQNAILIMTIWLNFIFCDQFTTKITSFYLFIEFQQHIVLVFETSQFFKSDF